MPARIARGTAVATFTGLLALLAGHLATRLVGAAEHALGNAMAHAGTAILVRLATLVPAKTATRTLAAAVGAAHARAAALGIGTALAHDLASGQRLARRCPGGRNLTRPRATVRGTAAALTRHPTATRQSARGHALADGRTLAGTTIRAGRATLASHATARRQGSTFAPRAVARAAVGGRGATSLALDATGTATHAVAGASQATAGAGSAAGEAVARTPQDRGAGAVLLAKERTTILGARTGCALTAAERVAAHATCAGAGTTCLRARATGTIAGTQSKGRLGRQFHVAHARRRGRRRQEEQERRRPRQHRTQGDRHRSPRAGASDKTRWARVAAKPRG